MSLFQIEYVNCPTCKKELEFEVVYSVNADRRPDLRDQILGGDFQKQTCPECSAVFRLEPEMTYFDVGRKQWILLQPAEKVSNWIELEKHALATFDKAYGDKAPSVVKAIGKSIVPRVTFGWPALREKVKCAELGLDDATLELMKLAIIRGLDDSPLADDIELRLQGADGDELILAWMKAATQQHVETLRVPKALYEGIANDPGPWQELRAELTAGPFVDLHRLLVPAEAGAA